MADRLPISTIYVQNLEEKVKLDTLTGSLYIIFSTFGKILEVTAKNGILSRGQAFVAFDRSEDAEEAAKMMQGFELYGKPMKTSIARTSSDTTIQVKCTAIEFEEFRQRRHAEKEKRQANTESRNRKRAAALRTDGSRPTKVVKPPGSRLNGLMPSNVVPDEYLPPNKVLFLQNISDDCDVKTLMAIFGRFEGFREVRLVPGRRGIAFVEYETEQGATSAKEGCIGMALGGKALKITYQRQ